MLFLYLFFPLIILSFNALIIDNIKAINKGNPINLLVFISKALYLLSIIFLIINEYLIIND